MLIKQMVLRRRLETLGLGLLLALARLGQHELAGAAQEGVVVGQVQDALRGLELGGLTRMC